MLLRQPFHSNTFLQSPQTITFYEKNMYPLRRYSFPYLLKINIVMLIFQLVKCNYYTGIILHHPIISYFLAIIALLTHTIMANIVAVNYTKNQLIMFIFRNFILSIKNIFYFFTFTFQNISKNVNSLLFLF